MLARLRGWLQIRAADATRARRSTIRAAVDVRSLLRPARTRGGRPFAPDVALA